MKFWKTIIALAATCFAGGFGKTTGQETTELETLEIQYTDSSSAIYSTPVAKDVESLSFTTSPITSLTLPEGLSRLKTLGISWNDNLISLTLPEGLSRLKELQINSTNLTHLTLPKGLSNLRSILLYGPLEADKQWSYPKELLIPHGMNTDNLKIGVAAAGGSPQWISIEERESTPFPSSYPFSIKYYKRSSSPAKFFRVKP